MPVAPEFRDPDKVENFPPFFTGSEPFFETMVTAPQTFTVKLKDRNPLDKLYVRWVAEYPQYQEAYSKILDSRNNIALGDGDTSVVYGPIPAACSNFFLGPSPHHLVVIVADRPFVEPENAENTLFRYNAAKENAQPIMGGWTVTCQ